MINDKDLLTRKLGELAKTFDGEYPYTSMVMKSAIASLQSFRNEVGMLGARLEWMKKERDAAIADIEKVCATCALCSKNNGTGERCEYYLDCNLVEGDHWVWRGLMPQKEEH